jgi:glutamate synthase (NADPH/NADH) large chain
LAGIARSGYGRDLDWVKWDELSDTKVMHGFDRDQRTGLYDPAHEHDNCGVGFVANIKGRKSHKIVRQGLQILVNLDHRGAVGADPLAGDGAGILIQVPDRLLREEMAEQGITLPDAGGYAVGMVFLPRVKKIRDRCLASIERAVAAEGATILGWREVPTDNSCLGESVRPNEPLIRQFLLAPPPGLADQDAFERKLFVIRKQSHGKIWYPVDASQGDETGLFYITSMSSRTIVYKGMVLSGNLPVYFPDLHDERTESALALVHQRFSTNTFPSWKLAQPFRLLCHNGEINTVRGNINWMAARRQTMSSKILGEDLDKLWPLIGDGASDSATFDNALELLVAGGYSLSHAVMMMIPEAWNNNPLMDSSRRAFYEYHAALMEPWDGPAAIAFTDGRQIGATLDRNGLRPARYVVTNDDLVIMGSEDGVLPVPDDSVIQKWRLQPGKMLLIDLEKGRIIDDEELKASLASAHPYQQWLDRTQIHLENLPNEIGAMPPDAETLLHRQQAFGYTQEDVRQFLTPMGLNGEDPLGSMGRDTPIAVLSDRPKLLFDYFKQCFAQVTNPPIDPIREELVMSLVSLIGPRPNLLEPEGAGSRHRLEVRQPIISNLDLERIRQIENHLDHGFRTSTLSITYPAVEGVGGMKNAMERLFQEAADAVKGGYNILILSDRDVDADHIPIPSLLATAGVHHHLIREGLRTSVGLVVETGEARQVHDFCLLAGYGAEAINPYLAFDTLSDLRLRMHQPPEIEELHQRYIKAVDKGILKVISKMGISTYQSYCGAQVFDAVGLSDTLLARYFTGTKCAIGGIGLEELANEAVRRHAIAYQGVLQFSGALDIGGDLSFRLRGETHAWTPETIGLLQHAARSGDPRRYRAYAKKMNDQSLKLRNIRALFEIKLSNTPIPLDEVEPAKEIVKRFATGAMSFGSISWEAHTTLAIAMNRIGGRSNSGEGGEDSRRFAPLKNGDSMVSRIKQVASGRFGVTTEYLVNATDLQIKMAQGAKPGEGGQLPGHKVDEWIGRVRRSTPGVGLISPPPHHDIYSIEDLAQLIHDLKNVNPAARVSVKLVSELGVGTVAAGVAKAHADHVTISGFEGGTGASPITSIQHAGSPWEIGLAETHETLVRNHLRGRIAVQVDGGFRTGRDVVVGALLGADEFGIATAALVSAGCIMMRKCHLNTCPVGVATQDPELRKLFTGQPEHVINFFMFLAEEVRELMAQMGFHNFQDMIGRREHLGTQAVIEHWKARNLDLSRLLYNFDVPAGVAIHQCEKQDHGLDKALDNMLIEKSAAALESGTPVRIETPVANTNRTIGAMLSGEIARKYGHDGLPDNTIQVKLKGSAGQSFGAFLSRGVTLELEGGGNDYVGKGLSGGRLIIYPAKAGNFAPEQNIIVGNTVLYGGIEGECFFRGVAGERFAVRNSGVTAVVEGVGDHGCEYMTGGVVVVLGQTGRNFGAGMSGGIAYVLDERGDFEDRCNLAMVELESIDEDGPPEDAQVDLAQDLTRHDARRLKDLIERHKSYTGSGRARQILDLWDQYLPMFVKVFPVDYRRALQEMQTSSQMEEREDVSVLAGE